MLEIEALRRQHQTILRRATSLRGLAEIVKTRQDAVEARTAIDGIDAILVDHLTIEDDHLYPALLASNDPAIAAMAAESAEEMGGILGAWIAYRTMWVTSAIMADPRRFVVATAGVIGALALRIERENSEIYPAMAAQSARDLELRRVG